MVGMRGDPWDVEGGRIGGSAPVMGEIGLEPTNLTDVSCRREKGVGGRMVGRFQVTMRPVGWESMRTVMVVCGSGIGLF